MNKTRIKRLKRVQTIEEKKLDMLVGELKGIQALLEQQESQVGVDNAKLELRLADQAVMGSVVNLRQLSQWSQQKQETINRLMERIQSTKQKLQTQMEKVKSQRATVKGWDRLIEKLQREADETVAKQQMISADDIYLRKNTRKIG